MANSVQTDLKLDGAKDIQDSFESLITRIYTGLRRWKQMLHSQTHSKIYGFQSS